MRRVTTVLILLMLVTLFAACTGETSREGANSTGTTTYNGSNSSSGASTQNSNTASTAPPASTPTPPGGIKPPTDKKN